MFKSANRRPGIIKSLRLEHVGRIADSLPNGTFNDINRRISAEVGGEDGLTSIVLRRPKGAFGLLKTTVTVPSGEPPIVTARHEFYKHGDDLQLPDREFYYDATYSIGNTFPLMAVSRAMSLAVKVCVPENQAETFET